MGLIKKQILSLTILALALPAFLAANDLHPQLAKNLDRIPGLAVDAVITSPPYLNGTNYFRNTKVELWFLRCLKNRGDLARFRFGAMTVGRATEQLPNPVVVLARQDEEDRRPDEIAAIPADAAANVAISLEDAAVRPDQN